MVDEYTHIPMFDSFITILSVWNRKLLILILKN